MAQERGSCPGLAMGADTASASPPVGMWEWVVQTLDATDSSHSSVIALQDSVAMIHGDLRPTVRVCVAQTVDTGNSTTIPVVWPPTLNADGTASLAAVSGMGYDDSSLGFG